MTFGALVGTAHPKICSISIYQTWSADCNRPYGRSKNYFQVPLSILKASYQKRSNNTMKRRKRAKISFMWFWVFWLWEHAPKSVKHQFNKLGWLTTTDPKKVGKLILKWLFLTRSPALTMKQRALWAEEKEQKRLIFDIGCSGWQCTPKYLFNINLPIWLTDCKRP